MFVKAKTKIVGAEKVKDFQALSRNLWTRRRRSRRSSDRARGYPRLSRAQYKQELCGRRDSIKQISAFENSWAVWFALMENSLRSKNISKSRD
jgi:hypothetical protein